MVFSLHLVPGSALSRSWRSHLLKRTRICCCCPSPIRIPAEAWRNNLFSFFPFSAVRHVCFIARLPCDFPAKNPFKTVASRLSPLARRLGRTGGRATSRREYTSIKTAPDGSPSNPKRHRQHQHRHQRHVRRLYRSVLPTTRARTHSLPREPWIMASPTLPNSGIIGPPPLCRMRRLLRQRRWRRQPG